MPTHGPRRLWRWGIAAAVVALIAGGAAAFILLHTPGNVSHPNLSFTAPATTTSSTTTARKPAKQAPPAEWLRYGFDGGRTRSFTASRALARRSVGWRFDDYALLEFPPVIYGNTLFVLDDDGSANSIDTRTGRKWVHKIGTLAAASPAVAVRQRMVVMAVLSVSGHSPGNGRFVALSMKNGHDACGRTPSRRAPSHRRSSTETPSSSATRAGPCTR